MGELPYDRVYGSQVFSWSKKIADAFVGQWPNVILRGTGTGNLETVEQVLGIPEYEHYDYSVYPDYQFSIGFTQRGCRLNCGFCVVPKKEGKPRSVNTIADIWRPDKERKVVLLDNDFFGQTKDQWQARIQEIKDGKFKVCFNQGINVRLITNEEVAAAIASVDYYDDQFKTRRLYTAWDNLKDEQIFFRGVDMLEAAGVSPKRLMVYMLIGYDPSEDMNRILYRFNKMKDRGIRPYPMVFNNSNTELRKFQRYVVRRYYEFIAWENYGKFYPQIESQLRMEHPSLSDVEL
jgi:hypothetical protein